MKKVVLFMVYGWGKGEIGLVENTIAKGFGEVEKELRMIENKEGYAELFTKRIKKIEKIKVEKE